jgi:hypothetical protein
MSRTICLAGIDYPIPTTTSELGSVLLVGLPKSGTTLLTKVFGAASAHVGVTHLPVHDLLYAAGISPTDAELQKLRELFQPAGYCYGAFRHAFSFLSAARDMPTIWIRRDPKDVIVSRYFSQAYSHLPPGGDQREAFLAEREQLQATELESFAATEMVRQAQLARTYLNVVPSTNLHVFWYEDIIYQKRSWIERMMSICGWQLAAAHVETILQAVDEFPDAETPNAFVRQVHPGNYQKHLSAATCERIDAYFAEHVPEWRQRAD